MKRSEAVELLAVVQVAFAHDLPEATVAMYVEHLLDLDYESASKGVTLLIRGGDRFFPRISDIRRAALGAAGMFPSFGEAWKEMQSMASYGSTNQRTPPPFSHAVIDELARQIGWENFRMSSEFDTYFISMAERRYRDICGREEEARLLGLPGLQSPTRTNELPDGRLMELADGVGQDTDGEQPS